MQISFVFWISWDWCWLYQMPSLVLVLLPQHSPRPSLPWLSPNLTSSGVIASLPWTTSYGTHFVVVFMVVFNANTSSFRTDRHWFWWSLFLNRWVRNNSFTLRIDLLAKPLPWLWYAVVRLFSIPNLLHTSRIILPSTLLPWSDRRKFGVPWARSHSWCNALHISSAVWSRMAAAATYFEKSYQPKVGNDILHRPSL